MKVPVQAVLGPPERRRAWLARLAAGEVGLAPVGCPCCTGRVEMQVKLARLLREDKPSRVYVELADEAHLATFERALSEWPLSQYVRAESALRLDGDSNAPRS